jgi:hypothetical protein
MGMMCVLWIEFGIKPHNYTGFRQKFERNKNCNNPNVLTHGRLARKHTPTAALIPRHCKRDWSDCFGFVRRHIHRLEA